jgi:hypothetical protein
VQDAENEIEWPLTTCNIAPLIEPNSFFKTYRKKIMSSQGHRVLKTSLKRLRPSLFFDAMDAENEFAWPLDTLKHRIIDFTKIVF